MKLKVFILVVFGMLILSSCTTTRVAVLKADDRDSIQVYASQLPVRSYVELGYIQCDGAVFHTPQKLLDGVRKKAAELSADAVIGLKYDFQSWYPVASGIAIKYTSSIE